MLSQLILLPAAAAAHHISSTPPRIAQESSNHLLYTKDKQTKKNETTPERGTLHGQKTLNQLGMIAVASTKYVVWTLITIEVLAILLSQCPEAYFSTKLLPILLPTKWINFRHSRLFIQTYPPPVITPLFAVLPPSRLFWFAIVSILTGYALRRECFRVMGRHFSFTHTTLENHQLVSNGPYGIVRHPSYTGEVLVRGGTALLLLRPGGFAAQCGALSMSHISTAAGLSVPQMIFLTSVRLALAFYIGWISFACTYLILRAPLEDKTLQETFGKTWEEYSKRVPYRFVPYVA